MRLLTLHAESAIALELTPIAIRNPCEEDLRVNSYAFKVRNSGRWLQHVFMSGSSAITLDK